MIVMNDNPLLLQENMKKKKFMILIKNYNLSLKRIRYFSNHKSLLSIKN